MILAEKFSQKLNNLKSKNEIKDFFIFFDEFRSLKLKVSHGAIGKNTHPTHYNEMSEGEYIIVWDTERVSTGKITTSSVGTFDEFINSARKTARKISSQVFIPERGIYPMVRTYSKALADMIDVPEYIFKLADILDEIDKMVGFKSGEGDLEIREGTRYAFSSRNVDEYFPYTTFHLRKVFKNHFAWEYNASEIPSIINFQELFSFLGDIYNFQAKSAPKILDKKEYNIILTPKVFSKLFSEQILVNLNGDSLIQNKSSFSLVDFISRKKLLGSFSLSYDPLLNQKKGSYKFTNFGLKPQKQYFIKFGKLETPILNNINFSQLGFKTPTINIIDISNCKFEGLKKRTFNDIRRSEVEAIYLPDTLIIKKKNKTMHNIVAPSSILFSGSKAYSTKKVSVDIDLIELISKSKVELIEFIDGQLGIKVNSVKPKFV